jgi:malonate decarboxylase beta subunit
VVEQEAGVAELDASDRAAVWRYSGGRQRVATGLADVLVADDTTALRDAVRAVFRRGTKPDGTCRSAQVKLFAARLAAIDPDGALDPAALPGPWGSGGSPGEERSA